MMPFQGFLLVLTHSLTHDPIEKKNMFVENPENKNHQKPSKISELSS